MAYRSDLGNREKFFSRGISVDSGMSIKPNIFSNVSDLGNREKMFLTGVSSDRLLKNKNNETAVLQNRATNETPEMGNREKIFSRGVSIDSGMTTRGNAAIFKRKISDLGNRERMFLSGVNNQIITAPGQNGSTDQRRTLQRANSYKEHGILNYHKVVPSNINGDGNQNSTPQNKNSADNQKNNSKLEIPEEKKDGGSRSNSSSRVTAHVKRSKSFALLTNSGTELGCISAGCSERRVLVVYTGGTIGMIKNSDGVLEPRKGAFEGTARNFPQLHDEPYWKKRFLNLESGTDNLVLPVVQGLDARIIYKIREYDNLMDSANITCDDWVSIARDIKGNYEDYDGFVVLHGTDTLAYTASSLSFMLENIGKPVVITGSQIPIFEPRSDGADNFVSALIVAGGLNIPEVTVMFGSKLFRGNRTRKISSHHFNAFDSPNFIHLVKFGVDIEVNRKAIFRPTRIERCHLHENMSKNVGILRIFPNISSAVLKAFFQPPIEGVVLETYGSGNIPSSRQDIFTEIEAAVKRGVIVVNITQCASGSVGTPLYETGRLIHACGVLSGYDMTPEAALAKLAYVLSKDEWSHAEKIEMMTTNMRGELTNMKTLNLEDNSLIDSLASSLKITSPKQLIEVTERVFTALLLYAIDKEEEVTIQRMQEMGADVNSQNSEGKTPLHEAIYKENINIVKYLLLRGANVHIKTRCGESPLLTAIQRDNHVIMKLLLNCGAHLASSDQQAATELLSLAARRGSVRRLQSMKLAGADFDVVDEMRQTALHKAVICNQPEVVKYLLEQGVRKDARDGLQQSPLDYARALQNETIIALLDSK